MKKKQKYNEKKFKQKSPKYLIKLKFALLIKRYITFICKKYKGKNIEQKV